MRVGKMEWEWDSTNSRKWSRIVSVGRPIKSYHVLMIRPQCCDGQGIKGGGYSGTQLIKYTPTLHLNE